MQIPIKDTTFTPHLDKKVGERDSVTQDGYFLKGLNILLSVYSLMVFKVFQRLFTTL
jgi:hypothetical protein